MDITYTLTFFGSAASGVRSGKKFSTKEDAEAYAAEHLSLMIKRGKSFRRVLIFKRDNHQLSVVGEVRA
jgi:hypothetical protein